MKGFNTYLFLEDDNGEISQIRDQGGYFPNIEQIHKLQRFLKKSLKNYHKTEKHNAYIDHCWDKNLNPSTGKPYDYDRPERPVKPGFVYIIKDCSLNYFKIGFSTDPKVRESTLQAEKPTLELVFKTPGTRTNEREVHRILREYRVRGEWFAVPFENAVNTIKNVIDLPF